ncbi:HIT domain-containing protein [Candidatus Pantoea multigeneris]|uniref:HIT domain-containing protein n=1 Tax=Candidatus Pantoea multigeneris TaxID=2608357 RepID=A0ABX0R7N2_9GAMM|nr:HIT domain-containing protein [Pantoea multigeneris]NIF21360.1 HIT domain-containing protein [Pantoea multigeneris]
MDDFCNSSCGICDEINGVSYIEGYGKIVGDKKNIIAETNDFLIVPSVGPLNNSHVMLITKHHVNSFASIDRGIRDEARKTLRKLNEFMFKKTGRPLIFFESGAGKNIDHSGGCIFHAHIHCVYHSPEFENSLKKEINFTKIEDPRLNFDTRNGYVWYMNNNYNEFICNNPLLPSQFLRYLYSNSNSIQGNWNWRRDNNISGIMKVIENYENLTL